MNQFASRFGMENTHFENATGLPFAYALQQRARPRQAVLAHHQRPR